jgi:imidazole glycerol-phosphate synthase subunit HisH
MSDIKRVTVIDYGIGNLLSVRRAFEHLGAEVLLSRSPEQIAGADRLVLPGVGAFGDGMKGLEGAGLVEPIQRYLLRERPFLGICLGMQMMFDASEEFGQHRGLGIIPGQVLAVAGTGTDGRPHKIPHTGWSPLVPPPGRSTWEGGLLAGLPPEAEVYFVHSFSAAPARFADRVADCHYDGRVIAAAVSRGATHGCQFHPEKSGPVGLRVIGNFLAL